MSALERALTTSEIILTVIHGYVDDIDTLLAIRHTCRAWLNTTAAYERSISQALVRKQFPNLELLHALLAPDLCGRQHTIQWLVQLIPRQLAVILVDRHRIVGDEHMFGIPALDPMGDPLRARVANGFRVLRRLSLISQQVHCREFPTAHSVDLADQPRPPRNASLSRRISRSNSGFKKLFTSPDVALARRRESTTFDRRREYVATLSDRDREDYQIMTIFLVGCFEHLWTAPATIGLNVPDGPLDFGSPPRRWIGRKDSWANWYLLHHGPMALWDQWWGGRGLRGRPSLFQRMEVDFSKRGKGVVNIERDFALKIEKELLKGLDHRRYNPPPELMAYQSLWDEGPDSRIRRTVPPDPLGCISFKIDEEPPPGGLHRDCHSSSPTHSSSSRCAVMRWAESKDFLRDRP